MAYEKYTIKEFEDAWHRGIYDIISKDELEIVRAEYAETAKLFDLKDLEMCIYISYLTSRINFVRIFVNNQAMFLEEFGIPYVNHLEKLNQFGHFLKWKNDKQDFINQLERIPKKEAKYETIIKSKKDELEKYRASKSKDAKEPTEKEIRESFLMTIISLRKMGHPIDKLTMTVEELSLVIKQQMETGKNQ